MHFKIFFLMLFKNVKRCRILLLFLSFQVCNAVRNIYYAEEACSQYKSSVRYTLGVTGMTTSAIIKATRSSSHSAPYHCNITLSTYSSDTHIILNIKKTDFYDPDSCNNYIELYIQGKETWKLCKDDEALTYMSHRRAVTFTYHTENKGVFDSGFEIVFTAYSNLCTDVFNFLCKNTRCISKTLKCDGINNCGDNSDELTEEPSNCGLSGGGIAGIILGVMLFVFILSIVIWCLKKRKQRRPNTRAYISKIDLNNT
ncbi:uncharacterized protein [Centruroides vittatus]|uniref:uncharacterized protein n=1 Tax=Centruroides vittatus TaxID=120091 RepID=UPI00350FB9C8